MALLAVRPRANVLATAIAAGTLGGILVDGFLIVANHMNPIQLWQFVASGLVGATAFTAPSYAALGLLMHFAISIAFGIVYVYAATVLPALLRHPTASGLVYGLLVMAFMTAILSIRHLTPATLDARTLIVSLVDHTVFFGLPIAWFTARSAR